MPFFKFLDGLHRMCIKMKLLLQEFDSRFIVIIEERLVQSYGHTKGNRPHDKNPAPRRDPT